jgi:hypothetical protein
VVDATDGYQGSAIVTIERYEIRVRGRLSSTMRSAFPDLDVYVEPVETVLTGTFDDQSALYGAIAQVENLGLELVEVRHVVEANAEKGKRAKPGSQE